MTDGSLCVATFYLGSKVRLLPKVPVGWGMEGRNGGLCGSRVNLLFLVAQPLQALEALLLLRIVSERLEDHAKAAGSSCHLTQLLLSLGCPSYAQVSTSHSKSRGYMWHMALQAHLFPEKIGY